MELRRRLCAGMLAQRAQALVVVTSVLLASGSAKIIELAAKHRLPTIHDWTEDAEAGGLMTYGDRPVGDRSAYCEPHREDLQGRESRRSAYGASNSVRSSS